jgi:hypothetical protein
MANVHKILVERPQGNIPIERSRKNDIKMILRNMLLGWSRLNQGRAYRLHVVNRAV